jgi:hypothetical protein
VNRILLAVGLFALWLVPSLGQLIKYLGSSGAVFLAAAALTSIFFLVKQSEAIDLERLTVLAGRLMPLMVVVTIAIFAVLYPISKSGIVGLGSDRGDALDTALRALLNGSYPYYSRTYLGNSLTPAPGAMLLALPFFLIGSSALQNLFWLPAFLYYSRYFLFRDPLPAVAFYFIFFLACPGALQDFVTGGDYLVNAIYVGIAVGLVARAHTESCSHFVRWSSYIFFAMAVSSRVIYGVAIPVIVFFVGQRDGFRSAMAVACFVLVSILVINLPFYVYDPASFAPLALGRKLGNVPDQFHATLIIPLVSVVIACLSLFVKLDETKLFGAIAVALLPVFAIPILFELSARGWGFNGLIFANYFLPVTVFGGVILISSFSKENT